MGPTRYQAAGPKTDQSARQARDARPEDWLVGGGEMGKLLRSMDWSKTALGPIDTWPQSLRTTISLCLASNFPISLVWGPGHVQIYNDGYWPICGKKHPDSMGQDFTECWASAWPAIGEAFERALAGETSFLENQRMFLDRNDYLEETFFTFSFSPIRDESGDVGGLFHPVTETTSRMLSERRTRALRDLAATASKAKTIDEACTLAVVTLSEYELDLPFILIYLQNGEGGGETLRLAAGSGLPAGTPASPATANARSDRLSEWPLAEAMKSGEVLQVGNLDARFGPIHCGPYPEPLRKALVLPITPPGCDQPVGMAVAGVSSRLPWNEGYRSFFDLLHSTITTVVATARGYEEERRRVEALAEIDRAKTEFFSNVSHEFRTPLTLMLGPLEEELAENDSPLPAARRERLMTAHRNSLRLLKLVNTLLDFSRIEAGRTQAVYRPMDLSTLTAELASVFRSAVEKAGITLTIDCPPLPEPVYVDREMWEKIVLNLLSNALKHTFEGEIIVRLRRRGTHAELAIIDSGVGIAAAELPRLFERFHRVRGARSRSHEGTGIGLALVKELASLHGGTVTVESQEGRGSTFRVTVLTGVAHLPSDRLGEENKPTSTAIRSSAYVEEALQWLPETATGSDVEIRHSPFQEKTDQCGERRPRIVLADDNADMRSYVARLLSEFYEVISFSDGAAALAAVEAEPPDLVLTDIMMPGLDGFGLLRALRSNPVTSLLPVILLSARAGPESTMEGMDAGANDYLAKPFSAQELLGRVRSHLELSRVRQEWAKDLARANEELETFSYSVSHDLRAPLRAMDGFSKALLEDHASSLDEEASDYLHRVRAAARKMSTLIDDLLDLSRISASPLRKEKVDMSEIAGQVVAGLQKADLQEGVRRSVAVEIADGLTAVGDRRLITIALENLLGNAWKYTSKQPDAWIRFRFEANADTQEFCVRDNGAGFNMTYADKLFSPFQRLHLDTEFEGNGIGLATVKRIIARHGGYIRAEAQPATGAAFFFTLEK